ncbi:hypothetical protein HU200_015941 [Digitaria exilis]|uniref:F-box domain-containing protein n=1 Tax=Digitaria exilis TaxID=1010633 RepID=A0A835F9H0_9POAL|nr:hypothetical protein HU200_015941 [Digitaria exilis]
MSTSLVRHDDDEHGKPHGPPLAVANDGVLPTDVLRDVLLRLPANVLCRFRLVCRSWRQLTFDPTFAEAHSRRYPLVVTLRVPSRHGRRCFEVQFMDPLSATSSSGCAWHDIGMVAIK